MPNNNNDWKNSPVIVIIGLIASLIAIFVFITGKQSIQDFFKSPTLQATSSLADDHPVPTPTDFATHVLPSPTEQNLQPASALSIPTPSTTPLPAPFSIPTPSATPLPAPFSVPTIVSTNTSTLPCNSVGQTWSSPIDNMVLVCVPAGEFLMGSKETDKNVVEWEIPQHTVYLDAYWIDQTEVTNAMFGKFVLATNYRTDAQKTGTGWVTNILPVKSMGTNMDGADWQHPLGPTSSLKGMDSQPVVQISWNDANAYCQWANRKLPTEAQWEKAARGTNGQIYPWGNGAPACYLTNFGPCTGTTTVVGNYPAGKSPYGTLDTAGNVEEWVADWFDTNYYSSRIDWRNPSGPASGSRRVLRGGSWYFGQPLIRSAYRYGAGTESHSDTQGFRCAR